jgi:peptidylprolyl isomerase
MLIVFLTTNCADSVRLSADDLYKDEELSINTREPQIEKQSGIESQSSSFATISFDRESNTIERQYYQQGEAVKIKKRIYPNKKDGYLLGDSNPIIIYVEIVPMVKEIKELWLHESIDDRLYIPYISNIYRVDTASEIDECKDKAINNISYINFPDQHNYTFSTNKNHDNLRTKGDIQLNKSQRLIYWYPILPRESGVYSTETSLRFNNDVFFPDMEYPLDIIIKEPQPIFDVGVTTLKKEVVIWSTYSSLLDSWDEPLDITYDITYLSGAGEDVSTEITFDEMKQCKFVNSTNGNSNNSLIYEKTLTKNATSDISKTIKFNKTGVFSIPAPTIHGKKWHFKGEEIIAETPLEKFREEMYVIFALVGLIFGNYISKRIVSFMSNFKETMGKILYRSEKTCRISEKTCKISEKTCKILQKGSGEEKVLFKTSMGDITIQLNQNMPNSASQFKEFINKEFYNGTKFSRIVRGSMIEGGDPNRTEPIPAIMDELTRKNNNDRGTIAMANDELNTWNGQFSINLVDNNFLDKIRPVLGRVVNGMDVVYAMSKVKTDEKEKPVKDVKIISAKVIT